MEVSSRLNVPIKELKNIKLTARTRRRSANQLWETNYHRFYSYNKKNKTHPKLQKHSKLRMADAATNQLRSEIFRVNCDG